MDGAHAHAHEASGQPGLKRAGGLSIDDALTHHAQMRHNGRRICSNTQVHTIANKRPLYANLPENSAHGAGRVMGVRQHRTAER